MLKTEELVDNLIKEKRYDERIIPFIKAFFLYNEKQQFWDKETIARKIELYKQKVDRLELANLGEKSTVFDANSKIFILNEELFENGKKGNLFESLSQIFEEQELIVKNEIDEDIKTGLYSIERMKYATNSKDKESIIKMISSAFNKEPKEFYDLRNNMKQEMTNIGTETNKSERDYLEACSTIFFPGIANEVPKIFNSSEDYHKRESYLKIYAISLQALRYRIENPKEDKAVIKQQYNQLKDEFYSKIDDYAIMAQDLEECKIDSTWNIPIDKINRILSIELQEVQAKKSVDVKIDDFVNNMKEENLSEIEIALNTTSQSVNQEYIEEKAEKLGSRYGEKFGPIVREYLKRSCKVYGWNKDELDKKVNNYLTNVEKIQFVKKLEGASISTSARWRLGKIEVKDDLFLVNSTSALGIFFHEQEHATDETKRNNHAFENGLEGKFTNEYATEIGAVHLVGDKVYDDKLCFTHSMEGYDEFKYAGSMIAAALGISEFEFARLRDKGERKFSSYMKEKYSYMDIEKELEEFESILYRIDSAPSIINMKQMSGAYADVYNMASRIIKARLDYEGRDLILNDFRKYRIKSEYEMTKIAVNMNLAKRKLHLKNKYIEPIIKDDTILQKHSRVNFKNRKDYLSLVEELYPEKNLQFDNKEILRHVSREFKHPIMNKISTIFKKNNTPMLNAPQEQPSGDDNNERKEFQKELRNGQEEPLTVNINENMLGKENDQPTIDEIVEEKGNEAK